MAFVASALNQESDETREIYVPRLYQIQSHGSFAITNLNVVETHCWWIVMRVHSHEMREGKSFRMAWQEIETKLNQRFGRYFSKKWKERLESDLADALVEVSKLSWINQNALHACVIEGVLTEFKIDEKPLDHDKRSFGAVVDYNVLIHKLKVLSKEELAEVNSKLNSHILITEEEVRDWSEVKQKNKEV